MNFFTRWFKKKPKPEETTKDDLEEIWETVRAYQDLEEMHEMQVTFDRGIMQFLGLSAAIRIFEVDEMYTIIDDWKAKATSEIRETGELVERSGGKVSREKHNAIMQQASRCAKHWKASVALLKEMDSD